MKRVFVLINLLGLLFSTKSVARAASEFTTSFSSTYTISSSGNSTITHEIILKNNLAHIYATDYTIALSGEELKGIVASDENGSLDTDTTIQSGITTIHFNFTKPAIGKDQEKVITLSYQSNDVVEIIADTMSINIPRLAKANEAESYTRIVKVESDQSKPSYIYPSPNKIEPDGNYTSYTFIGHQSDSLTLLFGESLTYSLELTYELKNKELKSGISEIALPPDTGYQKVVLAQIEPQPLKIRLDLDGNWLATYNLKSQEKLTVRANLYITVYPVPSQHDPSSIDYIRTSHSKYWYPNSSLVQDLSGKLKTPDNIYNYLVSNFTYNFSNLSSSTQRQGAIKALQNPTNSLCTEFTDAFVSLARSGDIASREINGYGYTKNTILKPQNTSTDLLHAWPEYYDKGLGRWISIDPTWGNTTGGIDYFNKLDFSHITFVRHGQEDSYPLPAGAYKSNPSDKFVQVEVAQDIPEIVESSEIQGKYLINTGNVALINDQVGYLPPYGEFALPTNQAISIYDKIKALCEKFLSVFYRR